MLQLLLEGGQGYDEIGSLLGVAPQEVRSRSREALRQMGGADPDARVQLSDYLLGQADPIGRADAARHLQNDRDDNELAARLVAQLRLLAPRAELPEIPSPRGARRAPAARSGEGEGARAGFAERLRGAGSSPRGKQLLAVAVGLGVLLIVGALAVAGVFAGGGDGSGDAATTPTAAAGEDLTIVELAPIDGDSDASGQAVFARTREQPLIQTNLAGLPQTSGDQIYVVWLYASERAAFPLARDRVGADGNLTGAAPIPNEVTPLLGQFGCIDVSLASTAETQRALREAVRGRGIPRHTGETVLRGQIPAAPGETAPSGAESRCEPVGGAGGGRQP